MNSDMLWLVMLTLAASPAVAATDAPAHAASAPSYSEKVDRADGSGPAANAEASVHRGARKAGHAVKRSAKKTGEAVGKGLRSTGNAIERAGEKVENKSTGQP